MADYGVGTELLELRRELAIRGRFPLSEFHAKNDKQRIRDLVFDVLRRANVPVDATILDKPKTQDLYERMAIGPRGELRSGPVTDRG